MRAWGFTGSRNGVSEEQDDWLWDNLVREQMHVHHGGCVGADYDVHYIAVQLGFPVTVHPPIKQRLAVPLNDLRSPDSEVVFMPRKEYLTRDRDIVIASDLLIGLPDGPPRPKSGTWYTISYAIDKGIPTTIVYPDGKVETR